MFSTGFRVRDARGSGRWPWKRSELVRNQIKSLNTRYLIQFAQPPTRAHTSSILVPEYLTPNSLFFPRLMPKAQGKHKDVRIRDILPQNVFPSLHLYRPHHPTSFHKPLSTDRILFLQSLSLNDPAQATVSRTSNNQIPYACPIIIAAIDERTTGAYSPFSRSQ